MLSAEFSFDLPDELIAQTPPPRRGDSRLLVLDRQTGAVTHGVFSDLGSFLRAGDLLALNNTRVFPARLLGHRVPSGGAVECLLVQRIGAAAHGKGVEAGDASSANTPTPPARAEDWAALMHPGQKLKPGARVLFERDGTCLHGEVLARHYFGKRTIRLWADEGSDVAGMIERIGHMPLPPYIKRADDLTDRERYQTVFASEQGSVAAPTAGLHFTKELLARLEAGGVGCVEVTLHVGYGTFKPVRAECVEDHVVDPEQFTVSVEAAQALTAARRDRRRIIAVGTTTARALESLPVTNDAVAPGGGETSLFIHPGHTFRIVDGLVTNFHLPRSSLLMLVCAFAGREKVLAAYREAVQKRYRFYSYGDAMLII